MNRFRLIQMNQQKRKMYKVPKNTNIQNNKIKNNNNMNVIYYQFNNNLCIMIKYLVLIIIKYLFSVINNIQNIIMINMKNY